MGAEVKLRTLLLGIVIGIAINELAETSERQKAYRQARMTADYLGKPLLVIGVPKRIAWYHHPGGDVTIDVDSSIDAAVPYQVADVRDIPYPDKYFGATYISHVLEHLPTVDDVARSLNEMHRVSDAVFIAGPHKTSLTAWLHPDHRLWVTPTGDGYIVEQREGVREVAMVRIK